MPARFADRVVLVTGAASGIGAATAVAFADEGGSVVAADVDEARGAETVERIQPRGGEATFVRADVGSAASVERLIAAAVERYGKLDVAVNNAGILPAAAPLAEISEEAFDRTIAINLRSVFLCMKHEIRQMLQQGGGAIVNMASFAGLIGLQGQAVYTASKHGVAGLTRAAALDYARHGIRINAVAPGVVRTPMLGTIPPEVAAQLEQIEPIGRVAEPEEVARAILFLASDDASFMTGHVMLVDGGLIVQ